MTLVTVITPTFNSESTLEFCIASIKNQRDVDIEHLVIDGLSKDRTPEILQRHNEITYVSEPDYGIYDAINKGLQIASGDFIAICHSDDFFLDNYALCKLIRSVQENKTEFAYADCIYVKNSRLVRYYKSGELNKRRLSFGLAPAHTTLVMRRSLLSSSGTYSLKYPICGDFDYFTRLLGLRYSYVEEPLVAMSVGGASNFNYRTAWSLNVDLQEILTNSGISTNLLKLLARYPYKKLSSQFNMLKYRKKNVDYFGN